MNSPAFLVDFGSTFTKITVVDLRTAELVGRTQAPSTVTTDVREGLVQALVDLNERKRLFDHKPVDLEVLAHKVVLASSSAAGGLKIVVCGLTPGLTVEAANQAALGAGGKVVGSTAFKLGEQAIQEIELLEPDILLLTGGTDGGDSATIVHNARRLANLSLSVPIIVAGNQAATAEVCEILEASGKEVRQAKNVMPRSGELTVESAREQIRSVFMDRITQAKGLDQIKELVPVILPTPMAVLQGVSRGAEGFETEEGWGDMLVVDVGGATTDVHSIGYGEPSGAKTIVQSLPEPFAKRTVEGDLGIRYNAATLLDRLTLDGLETEFRSAFPEFSVSRMEIGRYIEEITRETALIPREQWHYAADALLARAAVDLAVERHVGKRERIFAGQGEAWVYYGKDLSDTRTVVGTGGVFVHNPYARHILSQGPGRDMNFQVLRPKNPRTFMDSSYLLYAVGLLSEGYPGVAARLFRSSITPVAPQRP